MWAGAAVSILAVLAARAAEMPPPYTMPPIQRCFVEYLRVDGLPLVKHGWCAWDEKLRRWLPLDSEIARERVFGIRPIKE